MPDVDTGGDGAGKFESRFWSCATRVSKSFSRACSGAGRQCAQRIGPLGSARATRGKGFDAMSKDMLRNHRCIENVVHLSHPFNSPIYSQTHIGRRESGRHKPQSARTNSCGCHGCTFVPCNGILPHSNDMLTIMICTLKLYFTSGHIAERLHGAVA